jgi:hypothetical protein
MSLTLTGIGVTSGIAIGRVHRLTPGELSLPEYHLEPTPSKPRLERIAAAPFSAATAIPGSACSSAWAGLAARPRANCSRPIA